MINAKQKILEAKLRWYEEEQIKAMADSDHARVQWLFGEYLRTLQLFEKQDDMGTVRPSSGEPTETAVQERDTVAERDMGTRGKSAAYKDDGDRDNPFG